MIVFSNYSGLLADQFGVLYFKIELYPLCSACCGINLKLVLLAVTQRNTAFLNAVGEKRKYSRAVQVMPWHDKFEFYPAFSGTCPAVKRDCALHKHKIPDFIR